MSQLSAPESSQPDIDRGRSGGGVGGVAGVGGSGGVFATDTARVVMCDDPQLPGAFSPPAHEQRILKAVLDVMARQDPHLMHALCAWVEQRALPALSEPSILVLAKTIEEQHPWMLQAIPALDRRRESLHRMHAVAQAFRADNLARVRGHLDDQLERT